MKKIILILLLSVFAMPSYADEDSHKAAAEELLEVTGVKESMGNMADIMIEAILQPVSQQAACVDTEGMDKLTAKIKSIFNPYKDLGNKVVELYVDKFTEDEIKEIIAFNKSKIGQKLVKITPEIARKTMEFGQEYAQVKSDDIRTSVIDVFGGYVNEDGTCKAESTADEENQDE